MLTKKHPSEKPWDFRDMLGPREPERQQEPREEIDWGDWSETPPPQDRGPAPAPPPENIPEQADWDSWHDAVPPPIPEPEPTVPDLEPVDEVEPEPVAQEDWSEDLPDPMRVIGPDTSATQDAAIESPISDWAAPAASDVELEPSEPAQSDLDPADWGEPGSIDWGETEAFGEPDPMAPVVWPDPEEDPQPRPPEIESEAETLPCPGFELLDPVVNAPLVLPQEPVLVLDVAAFDLEPLTVREEPDQSWVFGTGWLDGDTEEAAARSEPEPAPFTLWSRMRVWLRWR